MLVCEWLMRGEQSLVMETGFLILYLVHVVDIHGALLPVRNYGWAGCAFGSVDQRMDELSHTSTNSPRGSCGYS
jgi:hypothetical protein